MKAACFTVACYDEYLTLNTAYAGGESLDQAMSFRKLGVESAFIGAVGTDPAGERLITLMQEHGIDTSHCLPMKGITPHNQIEITPEGEKYEVPGAWVNGVYGDFHMRETDWNYLAGFDIWATHIYIPDFEETLRRKPEGTMLSVDFLENNDYALMERTLDTADIVGISGNADMLEPLKAIAQRCEGIIVLTLGAEGSVALHGEHIFRQAALPLKRVLDTTGCGDSFHAAFAATWAQTQDIPAALLAGAQAARDIAGHYGALPYGWELEA